jgi:spore coat protein U-like protein
MSIANGFCQEWFLSLGKEKYSWPKKMPGRAKTRRQKKEEVMKKIFVVAVMALLVVAMAGAAMAADTNTLTVNANVAGVCKFVAATSTLNFAALDPSSSSDGSGVATVDYWCTKGAAAITLASNDGIHSLALGQKRLKGPGAADFIPYTITLTPDVTPAGGPGTTLHLGVAGSILNANYINASAGAYADTVSITVTP